MLEVYSCFLLRVSYGAGLFGALDTDAIRGMVNGLGASAFLIFAILASHNQIRRMAIPLGIAALYGLATLFLSVLRCLPFSGMLLLEHTGTAVLLIALLIVFVLARGNKGKYAAIALCAAGILFLSVMQITPAAPWLRYGMAHLRFAQIAQLFVPAFASWLRAIAPFVAFLLSALGLPWPNGVSQTDAPPGSGDTQNPLCR